MRGSYTLLPRYVLHERGYMPWQDVRPSLRLYVCLSVTRRYCVETAKLIVKNFSPSGSHIILVSVPNVMAIIQWGLPSNEDEV